VILLAISKNAPKKRYVGPMSNFLAAFCVLKPFLEISCGKNRMIAEIIPQWDRQTDGRTYRRDCYLIMVLSVADAWQKRAVKTLLPETTATE